MFMALVGKYVLGSFLAYIVTFRHCAGLLVDDGCLEDFRDQHVIPRAA
jgi:hypothetical protein